MKWAGGCSMGLRRATDLSSNRGFNLCMPQRPCWASWRVLHQQHGSVWGVHPLPQQHVSICHALHLHALTLLVLHYLDHGSVSAPLQLF